MILAVTLNIALDHYYYVPQFRAGNVHRVARQVVTAGGKGLNVARVVKQLQVDVKATGIIGGFNGQRILKLAQEDGLAHHFINLPIETRKCINIVDETGLSTELLESGDRLEEAYLADFIKEFPSMLKGIKLVTFSGSAMVGMPKTIYKQLIAICREQNIPAILDTSGDLLKHGIEAEPILIKPNQEELGQLIGKDIASIEDVIVASKKLVNDNIKYVVVSLGEAGALLTMKNQVIRAIPPKLEIVNVVGSGDSMVAALAASIMEQKSPEEMLRYSVAVSATNTLSEKTGDVDLDKMKDILPKIEIYVEKLEG
ncbi:1-phosphofructokinase family hexose kinase [Metasolibacillus sp. FSL H7-0170]|uniref:1-phosphofructokinase family hexose kinase n=1 Tax=Metasolibacillus sp. FSL H7-0170 TaxID=2921431 RepID=UPI003157F4B7